MVRFRHNAAGAVAAVVAALGAVPLAASSWIFLPVLIVPLLVAGWAWRAGTDADADGLRVRALLTSRAVAWTAVSELSIEEHNRVYARTTAGTALRLPAVGAADIPRLLEASGQPVRATG